MVKSPKILNLLKTIIYYLVVIGLFVVSNGFLKGGPCSPGFGIIVMLVATFTTLILIIRNFYLLSKNKKEHLLSFYLHVAMLLAAFILMRYQ